MKSHLAGEKPGRDQTVIRARITAEIAAARRDRRISRPRARTIDLHVYRSSGGGASAPPRRRSRDRSSQLGQDRPILDGVLVLGQYDMAVERQRELFPVKAAVPGGNHNSS